MIRFILKRRHDNSYGATWTDHETLDVDVPQLQAALQRGGVNVGRPGFDLTELVGVQILPNIDILDEFS